MAGNLKVDGWRSVYLTRTADELWFDDGLRNGFALPPPAPRWQRLWGIRHLRWLYWMVWVEREARRYVAIGQWPPAIDNWVLYAIGRGWV